MSEPERSWRCALKWHRWSRWKVGEEYIDTSYGLRNPSTMFYRRCLGCGLPQHKTESGQGWEDRP